MTPFYLCVGLSPENLRLFNAAAFNDGMDKLSEDEKKKAREVHADVGRICEEAFVGAQMMGLSPSNDTPHEAGNITHHFQSGGMVPIIAYPVKH